MHHGKANRLHNCVAQQEKQDFSLQKWLFLKKINEIK